MLYYAQKKSVIGGGCAEVEQVKDSPVKKNKNKKADVVAIVLAAGRGTRMGTDGPKQFACVCGRSVLSYSLETFEKHAQVDAIVVVCSRGYKERVKEICARHGISKCRSIVFGGETRRESSSAGVNAAAEIAEGRDSIVLIHDSARPLVTAQIISDNIRKARETGACVTAAPSVDTVVLSDDGKLIGSMPERSHVWCVQTPQSFRLGLIKDAHKYYEELDGNSRPPVTDDGGLVRLMGLPVAICLSDSGNFKITLPGDIDRMRLMVSVE